MPRMKTTRNAGVRIGQSSSRQPAETQSSPQTRAKRQAEKGKAVLVEPQSKRSRTEDARTHRIVKASLNVNRPETPSGKFASMPILPESKFARTELQDEAHTAWTLDCLARFKIRSLLKPAASVYYPRLVRLFYENLNVDNVGKLSVTVEGKHYNITLELMSEVLNIPHTYSDDLGLGNTVKHSHETMAEILAPGIKCAKTFILRSQLPPSLWLLDSIVYHNLFHMGHKIERRPPILEALYNMHTGCFYPLASLMLYAMVRLKAMIVHHIRGSDGKQLLFPYAITALLKKVGHPIEHTEPMEKLYKNFGALTYTKSINSLHRAIDMRERRIAADRAQASASHPPLPSDSQGAPAFVEQQLPPHDTSLPSTSSAPEVPVPQGPEAPTSLQTVITTLSTLMTQMFNKLEGKLEIRLDAQDKLLAIQSEQIAYLRSFQQATTATVHPALHRTIQDTAEMHHQQYKDAIAEDDEAEETADEEGDEVGEEEEEEEGEEKDEEGGEQDENVVDVDDSSAVKDKAEPEAEEAVLSDAQNVELDPTAKTT